MIEDRKCAHAGCVCPADPGSDYCGPACQTSNASRDDVCPCSHEVCQQGQPSSREASRDGSYDPSMSPQEKEKPLLDDWGASDKH